MLAAAAHPGRNARRQHARHHTEAHHLRGRLCRSSGQASVPRATGVHKTPMEESNERKEKASVPRVAGVRVVRLSRRE
eukprot:scaffold168120_cov19-Tisochrysis_lutea.AAC.1